MSRFAIIALIGGTAAACSSDRFAENPFSNPFGGGKSAEPVQTGSIDAQPAFTPIRPGSVSSAPLAAPGSAPRVASAPVYNAPPSGAVIVASSGNPAARLGPSVAGGWSPRGGTAVVVGHADNLATLSNRYGVPGQAILAANNLSGPGQVTPGTRLIIPISTGSPAAHVAAAPAQPSHVASAPVQGEVVTRYKLVEGKKPVSEPRTAAAAQVHPRSSRVVAQAEAVEPVKPVHPRPGRIAASEPVKPLPAKSAATVMTAKVEAPKLVKPVKTAETPAVPVKAAKVADMKVASTTPAKPVVAEAPRAKEPEATASLPAAPAAAVASAADFRWPAHGRVITGFGGSGSNEGINIAIPDGTPVKAAESGTVAYAGSEVKGYGNLVLIRHDNGYVSAYAHNGELDVKRGQKVTRGQVIAKSGQSGNVTSPQLHFELRKGSTPVDPMPHLASN